MALHAHFGVNASALTLIPKSTGLEDLESADLMPTELPVLEKDSGSHEKAKKLIQNQDADESVALSVLKSVDCNPSSYALSCIDTHTAADVEIVSCKLSARPRKLSAQPSCHFPACKSDTTLSSFPFLCKPRLSSAHSRRFLWVRRLTGLPPWLSCDMRGARLCEVGYRCRRQRACAACGGGCAEW